VQVTLYTDIGLVWLGLVWFTFSSIQPHMLHWTRQLQITIYYYNTTYKIWTSIQYKIINNKAKFKDQFEVESVATSRYMCIYINIPKS
jgi:hypothetical protein